MKFAAMFSSEAANVLPNWGKDVIRVNTKSKEVLGMEYIPTKQSLKDMVNCMIEEGWVEDKRPKTN